MSRALSDSRNSYIPPRSAVLAVGAGGMLGAAARYLFVVWFPTEPGRFPLTTFTENVLGAFMLGLLLAVLLEHGPTWTRLARPFLCTGVLGSFTTFSNFSIELVALGTREYMPIAVAYSVASLAVGLAAAVVGLWLGSQWSRRAEGRSG